MLDFPIDKLLDESLCTHGLERHLHPDGLICPHWGHAERRLFRLCPRPFPCLSLSGLRGLLHPADRDHLREHSAAPSHLRAVTAWDGQGRPTARLARELGLSRTQLHPLRQRMQANLNATAPTGVRPGTAFEADELYQHAGKKRTPPPDPADPPRRRANKRRGHGTYANDRPPIISVISRETGEQRWWVCDHADRQTCAALSAENIPAGSTWLYTDEWPSYRGSHPAHATVRHGVQEWARDDDGDGRREGPCNACEGAGAALRTSWRAFRGVHKRDLHPYVATYEALVNAKQGPPKLIQRMCVRAPSAHSSYT